uniref:Uncharacterized protein n=1 Tax=Panagrolaimus sp. PS1159 TaxID=55785 RepID=A0AC35GXD7_9BILA
LIVCYTNKTVIECVRKWLGDHMEERKLRRQSEDKRIHFKRSIENSYATERLFLEVHNSRSYGNSNGTHLSLKANLSRDSDDYEESVNLSGVESHHDENDNDGHVFITNINGETKLESPSKTENFV